ncbi:endospore germination permease [Paenibacillus yanchengensis]|uniref:Endospore germination permease n=1 Tax=Paenibacillus yanchengensis TaxID=2035833 RepID=A0ABW4YM26_9BACL
MTTYQISNQQFTILASIITIGDAILMIPYIITEKSQQDAWFAFLIGIVIGMAALYFITKVISLFPNLSIVESSSQVLGKWVAIPFIIIYLLYFSLNITTHIREAADFVVIQVMSETPLQAIILLILLATVYGALQGIEVIARASQLFFPFMVIIFFIVMFMLISKTKLEYIWPFLENGMFPVWKGVVPAASYPFMELCFLFLIAPFVEDKSKLTKNIYIGAAIGAFFIFIMLLMSLLVLGPYIVGNHLYPSYTLAKKISFGNFIQRIEGTLALLWTVTIFIKIAIGISIVSLGLKQMLQLPSEKKIIFPLAMVLFYSSITLAPNVVHFNETISNYWWLVDTIVGLVLPLFFLIVYGIRKTFNKQKMQKQGE